MKRCLNCNKDISKLSKVYIYCSLRCVELQDIKKETKKLEMRQKLMAKYNYLKDFVDKCEYCFKQMDVKTIDHMIPYSKIDNLYFDMNYVIICKSCNSSKGTKDLLVWAKEKNIFLRPYIIKRYQNIKNLTGT